MNKTIQSQIEFTTTIPGVGELFFKRFNPENDIHILYNWVKMPYAHYWGMNDKSFEEIKSEYTSLCALSYYDVFIGCINDFPVCIIEKYWVAKDRLSAYYDYEEQDYGMHILIAPPVKPIRSFTWHIFSATVTFLFEDNKVGRIVVEPDVRNTKIHKLNAKAGFIIHNEIDLPEKRALLSFCTRSDFNSAKNNIAYTKKEPDWLVEDVWIKVNKRLVSKAISEFSHELLVQPEPLANAKDYYYLNVANQDLQYVFKATRYGLDHWDIDINSLTKQQGGTETTIEALDFIIDFRDQLNIPDDLLGVYLEEITSTLISLAYKHKNEVFESKQLVDTSFQQIEHAMTEGHPCFVANSGKIGFNKEEFLEYTPEADQKFSLVWVAGHKSRATFTALDHIAYLDFMKRELGEEDYSNFMNRLKNKKVNPSDYFFIPVHPWQWSTKISHIYAHDIANDLLIYLDRGKDQFSPQQSIRTLYNVSYPHKNYTKVALSILNMGFTRGLSPYYMKSTPHITSWINTLLNNDIYLKGLGFQMLGEIATVGYENTRYAALGKTNSYNKMLSALWRESPYSYLKKGQNCLTMASLLHEDSKGEAFIKYVIKASGLNISTWIEKYLNAYLKPILHCFYAYELVFMPHGENVILIMENHFPVGILMKDITEEVIVFNQDLSFNEHSKRLYVQAEDHMKVLTIFTDVFDSFFRFLVPILHQSMDFKEDSFWKLVAESVKQYQMDHPQFNEKYSRYDIFKPAFERCCLNRLQLRKTTQMLNLTDPVQSLILQGELTNPLAKHK